MKESLFLLTHGHGSVCSVGPGTNRRNGSFLTFCQFYSYLLFSPGGSNKGKELNRLSAFLTIPHSRGESDNKQVEHIVCVCVCVCVCVRARMCVLSHARLCNPMDHSLPGSSLSMGFSRQEYWSGLPFPPSGYPLDPGIKPEHIVL